MPDRIDPLHQQGTHHWLITLDGLGSRSGTCNWQPDETRYDLYQRIRSAVLDEAGLSDRATPVTIHFDIQPNHLRSHPCET